MPHNPNLMGSIELTPTERRSLAEVVKALDRRERMLTERHSPHRTRSGQVHDRMMAWAFSRHEDP